MKNIQLSEDWLRIIARTLLKISSVSFKGRNCKWYIFELEHPVSKKLKND